MRIGIDVDDVLFPWFDKAHAACVTAGITGGVTPSQWECWRDYGCTKDEWLAVMETATLDGTLYRGTAYPNAIAAMRALKDFGHTLHLVTARGYFKHGDLIRQHTIEWLADVEAPHDSLTFSKDKTVAAVDVFVDDSVRNIEALEAAGTPTFLVDSPHNQEFDHPRRVESFVEFASAILAGVTA